MKQKLKALGGKVWTVVEWVLDISVVVFFVGFGISLFFNEAGNRELGLLYLAVGSLMIYRLTQNVLDKQRDKRTDLIQEIVMSHGATIRILNDRVEELECR